MCVLSIKVPIRKNSGNLFNDPGTNGLPNLAQKTRLYNNQQKKKKKKKEKRKKDLAKLSTLLSRLTTE